MGPLAPQKKGRENNIADRSEWKFDGFDGQSPQNKIEERSTHTRRLTRLGPTISFSLICFVLFAASFYVSSRAIRMARSLSTSHDVETLQPQASM